MDNYFSLVSIELLNKLHQLKQFNINHNSTIGVLTEEILRTFLKENLPNIVNVEQGFIRTKEGKMSNQIDILIYNSLFYSPLFRVNDIVIVPEESVIAIIEVKTTINKTIFHSAINYFKKVKSISLAKSYLFIYNSENISKIEKYFSNYDHESAYKIFDHDTFQLLPDEITGINDSFHLKKDLVTCFDKDSIGYSSYFFENEEGTEINALQQFYISVYKLVETEIEKIYGNNTKFNRSIYYDKKLSSYSAIELFDM